MKRPEGFDRRPPATPPTQPRKAQPTRGPGAVPRPDRPQKPERLATPAPKREAAADRELRRAAAARRRYERSEVRRFTRRSRRRRITALVLVIWCLLLGGLVTGAVY